MERMDRYMSGIVACSIAYSRIHGLVASGTGLRDACGDHFCGRFFFEGEKEVDGIPFDEISVSFPPDASGNRMKDHPSFPYKPTTIETMLVLHGELNGDSMQRFDSVSEVIVYINKLKNGISAAQP